MKPNWMSTKLSQRYEWQFQEPFGTISYETNERENDIGVHARGGRDQGHQQLQMLDPWYEGSGLWS